MEGLVSNFKELVLQPTMLDSVVNINGILTPGNRATVSVFDHGFLYGDGVYETLRSYNRKPFLLKQHFTRLRTSARRLLLQDLPSDRELESRILETIPTVHPTGEVTIRILVTRGVGDLSYNPTACPTPTTIIITRPHHNPPDEVIRKGIKLIVASVVRNHPRSVDPSIKSNNLLNNILAMQEAFQLGAAEAILLNQRGELTECSQSNLFAVRNGVALTPPLKSGLLEGVTRNFLFKVGAQLGTQVRECVLTEEDFHSVDELFITSTTREIVPVVSVGNQVIGDGTPGPITSALLAKLREMAQAVNSPIEESNSKL